MLERTMVAEDGFTTAGRLRPAARRAWRIGRAVLLALAVAWAVALVTGLTVDLGPMVRARAEAAGSNALGRPLHIGHLSARLLPGQFVLDDLVIEGLTPGARPFLTAGRIVVSVPWWTIFGGEILIESVHMTDWRMVVESWPEGRHSFPRFTRQRQDTGPGRFTTTVRSVRAQRGEFVYEDHATPWTAVARSLEVAVRRSGGEYRGSASFTGGTVQIQAFEPMQADMHARFTIEGPVVRFSGIDLRTDGALSEVTGEVDLARWPAQRYEVRSQVDFARMRQIFFSGESFRVTGDGRFAGTFHLFPGGRELTGRFASDLARVNDYRFSALQGSLRWLPDRFEVTDAAAGFQGGLARFTYAMAPLGGQERPIARFETDYEAVNLAALTDFLETEGLRLAGQASGRTRLEWPLGQFAARHGHGRLEVRPPAGAAVLGRELPAELLAPRAAEDEAPGGAAGPFDPHAPLGYVPVGGDVAYAFGPEWIELGRSWLATERSHVEFEGRTAYGERSRIPFRVTSADWQESDRVLAAVLTAFGSRAGAVPVGGHGGFEGIFLQSFRNPRIEGTFAGERLWAWNVVWGAARGSVVIENGYVEVSDGVVTDGDSEIHASGRFSLGYPRSDGGEEIDARIRIAGRPLADLRRAFQLHDYPVDGGVFGEYHLLGKYEAPLGFGRMTIRDGMAYGEPFESASGGLRFEGEGVRIDGVQIAKSGGTVTGAAYVDWTGSYSFNADGRRIPMESVVAVAYPQAPLTGLLQFSASGSGAFASPRYDLRGRIDDLFVGDEGIGQVTGRLAVRGEVLTVEVEAASPRLTVSGAGRIALTPEADAELAFRFADTSLDPYVRFFEPRLSPFTTAVASGTVRVAGELSDVRHLLVDMRVEQLELKLFDYRVSNDGVVELALEDHGVHLRRFRLAGEGTQLDLAGSIDLDDERMAVRVTGDANLGILQGFFRDISSSGEAALLAEIQGPMRAPVFTGHAAIRNGRIRHFSLPHSLEAVNGRVVFDAGGVRMDDLAARLGGGPVRFGGRIVLDGFEPREVNVTLIGEQMRVRFPEGFRSMVDADLALRGDLFSPVLTGTVSVRSAVWTRRFETLGGFIGLTGTRPATPAVPGDTLPLTYDIRIVAPSALRIENNLARIVASADVTLRGSYDRPLVFGRAEIERGEVLFEGNRYLITRGTIDFANPARIEPFFDIAAETRIRLPGQTYRVTVQATGTVDQLTPTLDSDPPLAEVDIFSLLFGDARDPEDARLRALRQPGLSAERELLQTRAARLLASPISSEVGRVVEQTFGIDTVQILPSLIDPGSQQLNPTARLTIGKRISDRLFLTFSRALNAPGRDQILLVEYDQTDRVSWILSQTGERTYALEFRVRHTF